MLWVWFYIFARHSEIATRLHRREILAYQWSLYVSKSPASLDSTSSSFNDSELENFIYGTRLIRFHVALRFLVMEHLAPWNPTEHASWRHVKHSWIDWVPLDHRLGIMEHTKIVKAKKRVFSFVTRSIARVRLSVYSSVESGRGYERVLTCGAMLLTMRVRTIWWFFASDDVFMLFRFGCNVINCNYTTS